MLTEKEAAYYIDRVFSAAYQKLRKGKKPGEFSWDKIIIDQTEFNLNGLALRAGEDPLNGRNSLTVDDYCRNSLPWSIIFVKHIKFEGDQPIKRHYYYDIIFDTTSVVHYGNKEPWNIALKLGFKNELDHLLKLISPNNERRELSTN
ncbi:MAG: hypothetical protein HYW45_01510 [Candidatus Daviesbacteria bacterium]|nr:MAG: hypothetical protein HYW45_01510 [Candidatus Daviesbacteria bacterium]